MMIKVENLVKRYGNLIALDHLNLQVGEGEIFGLLGPNGAGKTTAINCMLSLLSYDKGTIQIFGKDMSPTAYGIKKDIGVVMQDVAVFQELTVYENIDYFCGLYVRNKARRSELVREAIRFAALEEFREFHPSKLSGGLLRRLNIACGIAHKPKLILMDEPTVAVDPQSRDNILKGILRLNREGATILYTSHYMEEIEQICTQVAIMDKGKTIASGTKEELKDMIDLSERIRVQIWELSKVHLNQIKALSYVTHVEYKDNMLSLKSRKGEHNLARILQFLQEEQINYGRVFSELPTLNDVFLELTGKGLGDHV